MNGIEGVHSAGKIKHSLYVFLLDTESAKNILPRAWTVRVTLSKGLNSGRNEHYKPPSRETLFGCEIVPIETLHTLTDGIEFVRR
jgi:hypothetical protein